MRKPVCALIAFCVFVSGIITGCTSSTPFDKEAVKTYVGMYGIHEFTGGSNADSAISSFSSRQSRSAYYVSKDAAEAKKLYKNYVNENNYYPKANINDIIVVAAKEQVLNSVYETDCCVFYFDDKSEAKAYYDAYVSSLDSDHTNKTGYKDGYAYAITYSLSANRDGNCDWMKGVYLKGNSILLITGFSPIGIVDTFSDYIYNSLNVIDPATLK